MYRIHLHCCRISFKRPVRIGEWIWMTNCIIYALGLNSRALRLRWVDIWLRLTPEQCWLRQRIVFWWSVLAKLVEDISWAASWLSGVSPTGLRRLLPDPVLFPRHSWGHHRCWLCRSGWMAREASGLSKWWRGKYEISVKQDEVSGGSDGTMMCMLSNDHTLSWTQSLMSTIQTWTKQTAIYCHS